MARVIGPTPPGIGASQPATSATSAATSPTSRGRFEGVEGFEVEVPVRPGDADVDHRRAGLDHIRGEQPGPSRGHHHDVRGPGVRGEILGPGVAQRDRGVLGTPGQQQSESAAHGDPAPDDGDVGARDGHPVAAQQFGDPARRARQRAGLTQDQLAQVGRVQAIRVLGRVHPVEHGVGVEPGGQRQLDDVPGAGRIGVQFVDHRLHLRLGGVGGQVPADGRDPDLSAVPVLAVHVGAAAGIVADQDRAEPGPTVPRRRLAARGGGAGLAARGGGAGLAAAAAGPRAASAATRCVSSARISAATALPSSTCAVTTVPQW